MFVPHRRRRRGRRGRRRRSGRGRAARASRTTEADARHARRRRPGWTPRANRSRWSATATGGRRPPRVVAGAAAEQPAPAQAEAPDRGRRAPLAKPPVRKLAKDLGVDLAAVAPGSGDGGSSPARTSAQAAARRMVDEQAPPPQRERRRRRGRRAVRRGHDAPSSVIEALVGVEAPAGARSRCPGSGAARPARSRRSPGIRKRIIAKMEQSRRDIPHALCSRDADLTALWELRRDLTDRGPSAGARRQDHADRAGHARDRAGAAPLPDAERGLRPGRRRDPAARAHQPRRARSTPTAG